MLTKKINIGPRNGGILSSVLLQMTIVLIALAVATAKPSESADDKLTEADVIVPDPVEGAEGTINAPSASVFINIGINRDNPQCNPAFFGENTWLGFNVYDDKFLPNSPWDKSKLKFDDKPSSYSNAEYTIIFDDVSLQKSLEVKSEMTGSYMIFSMTSSVDYAYSSQSTSTSTSVDVLMRRDSRSLTMPFVNDDLKSMMTEEAKELAKNDPSAFVDRYGTHFISMQQYGCLAQLQGSYIFDTLEETEKFKASLGVNFKTGSIGAGGSSSVEKLAKEASKKSRFNAKLTGDTFTIKPEEPGKLDSWTNALVKDFQKDCMANVGTHEVKTVAVRSWSSVFSTIPADSDLLKQDVETLMKAKLTQTGNCVKKTSDTASRSKPISKAATSTSKARGGTVSKAKAAIPSSKSRGGSVSKAKADTPSSKSPGGTECKGKPATPSKSKRAATSSWDLKGKSKTVAELPVASTPSSTSSRETKGKRNLFADPSICSSSSSKSTRISKTKRNVVTAPSLPSTSTRKPSRNCKGKAKPLASSKNNSTAATHIRLCCIQDTENSRNDLSLIPTDRVLSISQLFTNSFSPAFNVTIADEQHSLLLDIRNQNLVKSYPNVGFDINDTKISTKREPLMLFKNPYKYTLSSEKFRPSSAVTTQLGGLLISSSRRHYLIAAENTDEQLAN
eukprot:Nk52_evm7s274 gene=Nk52_evmTU7s274